MKELTIEQKAQRYNEALERAKGVIGQNPLMEYLKKGIEYIFPELKEFEDERIRKAILELVRQSSEVLDKQNQNNMLAWLEKQGEQEPTAWSEEDEKRIQRISDFIWKNRKGDTDDIYQQEQDVKWLKSLKERIGG